MSGKPTRSPPIRHRGAQPAPRFGLARVLNKLGACSRSQAVELVRAGRVRVDGRIVSDPEKPTDAQARIEVDGAPLGQVRRVYLMLNKPRGYVTSASDERGRETVYALIADARQADATQIDATQIDALTTWIAPVGRLDKASEGLLLFSNDSTWAARLTDPATHLDKTYHVQIDTLPDAALLQRLTRGIDEGGDRLAAKSVRELRRGAKNAWLEIVLDEGRNRHIRRLLDSFDVAVLRLIRVAIGPLPLGALGKGKWRVLTPDEVAALRPEDAKRMRGRNKSTPPNIAR